MIINSLKLKNIRSYTEEEIRFQEGSTLLSGDIGTGKTSALLAIEFALFGIIRGQLSGSALLRHGKNEGSVELTFTLENKNITIKRTLKRTLKGVTQDSGYIIIGNLKIEGTPIELKSRILKLIGYPDELLTKSKSYIYRYTVYTPQEEMKHILFEGKNERLDVLRKIFDIDKYKRIKEHTILYVRELKTLRSILETRIEDLEGKKNERKEYDKRIETIDEEIKKVTTDLEKITKKLEERKTLLESFEKKIKEFEELKKKTELNKLEVKNSKDKLEYNRQQIEDFALEIKKLREELTDFDEKTFEALKAKKEEHEKRLEALEKNLLKVNERETELKTKKFTSEEITNKISSLDLCPLCKQRVTQEHKQEVKAKEEEKLLNINATLKELSALIEKRQKEKEETKAKLEFINKKEKQVEVNKVKFEVLKEKTAKTELLKQEQQNLSKKIMTLQEEARNLEKQKEIYSGIETQYQEEKKHVETIREAYNEINTKKASLLREKGTINEIREKINQEIRKKLEAKKKLSQVQEIQHWLIQFFLNIINVMEKHILLRIHQEFNTYFAEWFNILIEDENLNVRLDDEFSPVIEQNGYETYIENLSGGERTSVALAYRLALNKVINDFIGMTRTKDLLILDEPTDGFSTEQLDKLRDVLEQLRIRQVILVSHEPKLESYVDNIIRINKEEHESRVVS